MTPREHTLPCHLMPSVFEWLLHAHTCKWNVLTQCFWLNRPATAATLPPAPYSRPFKCVHRLNWPQHILPSLEELAGCGCDCKWQSCYDVNSRTRTESDIHSGWKSDLWKCDIKRFPLYSLSSSLFPLPLSPSLSGCLHTDITLFTRQVSKVKTPSHTAGVRPL